MAMFHTATTELLCQNTPCNHPRRHLGENAPFVNAQLPDTQHSADPLSCEQRSSLHTDHTYTYPYTNMDHEYICISDTEDEVTIVTVVRCSYCQQLRTAGTAVCPQRHITIFGCFCGIKTAHFYFSLLFFFDDALHHKQSQAKTYVGAVKNQKVALSMEDPAMRRRV